MQADAPARRPRRIPPAFGGLLIALVVWAVFSWPLPARMLDTIPSACNRRGGELVEHRMTPGDHLQLLYNFWLLSDMLRGGTPFFYNLYEFNTGRDEERYDPEPFYTPLSLCFAAGHYVAGRAFGWNLTIVVSLWLTAWFSWRLALRIAGDPWIAALLALLAIGLPYRWATLNGGSPTGFGMTWVPLLLLGLDIAVRDGRRRGGLLAGVAVLFTQWADPQTFTFAILVVPFWCLFALVRREDFAWTRPAAWLGLLRVLWPAALALVLALATLLYTLRRSAGAAAGGGVRTNRDVLLSSPGKAGLYSWAELGVSNHIYVGYAALALVAAVVLVWGWLALRDRRRHARGLLAALLLFGALGGAMSFACGLRGPAGGLVFRAARGAIPPLRMIRQPAKVFSLVPSLLVAAAALAALGLARSPAGWRGARLATLVLVAAATGEYYFFRTRPVLCRLDDHQDAYAAAADDARARGAVARALVVPLWPGDSHFAAVYEHFASLYRIRMINGYRPFVPQAYVTGVFERLQSANLGALDDGQVDDLLARGIGHVIVHEDLFPEKVSPFPIAFTLAGLFANPRLEFLRQDRSVWAFRLLPAPRAAGPAAAQTRFIGSSRLLECERMSAGRVDFVDEPGASGGRFIRFERAGGHAAARPPPILAPAAPNLRWLLRVRGEGGVRCWTGTPDGAAEAPVLSVSSPDWRWVEAPVPAAAVPGPVTLAFLHERGRVDADLAVFAAGPWPMLEPGQTVEIPAADLFHAGHSDPLTRSVILDPDGLRAGAIVYGLKLPVACGRYRATVVFDREGTAGVTPQFIVACPEGRELARAPLEAGPELDLRFEVKDSLPLLMAVEYRLGSRLTVHRIRLAAAAPGDGGT